MATELTIGAAKGALQTFGWGTGAWGLGSLCDLLAAELMVCFWFAVGVIVAIKMVHSLEELISRK